MSFNKAPAKKRRGYAGTNTTALMIQEEMRHTKVKRHHNYWCYAGVATIAFSIGLWCGVVFMNGTWSWS